MSNDVVVRKLILEVILLNLKTKRALITLTASASVVAALAGCGTSSNNSSSKTSTTGGGNAASTNSTSTASNTSSSNETLVLYSAQGYDQAMADAFTKATGIKVKLVDDSTGNIVAKMEAEKSNPHWDVAWFDGAATMQGLDNEGMLLTGFTPNDVSDYTSQGQSLIPSDKAYYPTGVTAAAAIGYNNKLVDAAHAPKDWSDLLNPYFKGAIGMNDPSISGPTFPYVAGMMQMKGTAGGEKFYSDLKANGMKVFPTNGDTLNALLKGQIKVATIQDTALLKGKLKGDPITLVYPSSGTFSLPSVIGIDKNAPDMDAAKKFVEFVLSQEGQKVMIDPNNGGSDSYYNPIITGITANPARQQSGINWVAVDPVKAAQNETEIKQWFHENITN